MEKTTPNSPRNMNTANPFADDGNEFNSIKQQGDDQKQLNTEYKEDYEGWKPIKARRLMRKQALWDMPNAIPGMRDPEQGVGSPFSGAGESPNPDRYQQKTKTWPSTQRQVLLYKRNKAGELEIEPQDTLNETVYNYGEESAS